MRWTGGESDGSRSSPGELLRDALQQEKPLQVAGVILRMRP